MKDLKEDFKSWAINPHLDDGPRYTPKTTNEYIKRINRVCDKLYEGHSEYAWRELAEGLYPVLLFHAVCTKKWHDKSSIDVENVYAILLKDEFLNTPESLHTLLSGKKFEDYLYLLWNESKDVRQTKAALVNFNEFLYKTDHNGNKAIYDQIRQKLGYIKSLKQSIFSFDFIEATETTPKRIISKNGATTIGALDLVYFLNCCRRTVGKLVHDKKIKYANTSSYRYSIEDINQYLKEKHSYCKNTPYNANDINQAADDLEQFLFKDLASYLEQYNEDLFTPNKDAQADKERLTGNIIEKLTTHVEKLKNTLEDKKSKKWCTLKEATVILDCSKKVIQGLRDRGKLCYTQYSHGTIKYLISDLNKIKVEREERATRRDKHDKRKHINERLKLKRK